MLYLHHQRGALRLLQQHLTAQQIKNTQEHETQTIKKTKASIKILDRKLTFTGSSVPN